MRTASMLLAGLAALGVATASAGGQGGVRLPRARFLEAGAKVWATAHKPLASWEVEGWGRNQAEAEEAALRKARSLVEDFLRQRNPELSWSPSVAFVRKHLVTGPATRRKEKDQPVGQKRELPLECWTLPVAVTPTTEHLLAQAARAERAEGRLRLLGKVLVGVVLLLVGVVGYLKLDEWTRGSYSRWLQGGLVGLLAAAGVGLWWWS